MKYQKMINQIEKTAEENPASNNNLYVNSIHAIKVMKMIIIYYSGKKTLTKKTEKEKARKGRANRKEWVITKNQRKRQEGVAYKGLGKTESGTWKYTIPRAERKLNPRCHCALSKKKSKIQCNEFSEDRRERIFKESWKFTWHEKKVFVNMLVDTKNPRETKNKQNEISRRKVSLFFLSKKRWNQN
jgi:hypothetical protein